MEHKSQLVQQAIAALIPLLAKSESLPYPFPLSSRHTDCYRNTEFRMYLSHGASFAQTATDFLLAALATDQPPVYDAFGAFFSSV